MKSECGKCGVNITLLLVVSVNFCASLAAPTVRKFDHTFIPLLSFLHRRCQPSNILFPKRSQISPRQLELLGLPRSFKHIVGCVLHIELRERHLTSTSPILSG